MVPRIFRATLTCDEWRRCSVAQAAQREAKRYAAALPGEGVGTGGAAIEFSDAGLA